MKRTGQAVPNKLLVNERLHCQWSQKEVANLVGTTTINVSRWERGITSPSAHFRYQLCILFSKSEEELGLIYPRPLKEERISSEPTTPSEENITPVQTLPLQTCYIPLQRNPLFTGREDILNSIDCLPSSAQNATLKQSCILCGMGGIGKTQIALEYAYRHRQDYQAVLWIDASSLETLAASVTHIANLLPLLEGDEQPQVDPITTIKNWLRIFTNCLLVLDNADDIRIICPLLSVTHSNRILLTTRTQVTGTMIPQIDIGPMRVDEGTLFLLRRARYLDFDAPLEHAPRSVWTQSEHIVEVMGGLALALDQAGTYIEETDCSLSSYLALYKTQGVALLGRRGRVVASHPESVASTILRCVESIEEANPIAADLLRACALLDLDVIPEEVITEKYVPDARDPLKFDAAIAEIRKYSLIRRNPHAQTLTLHCLTQIVLREKYIQSELLRKQTLIPDKLPPKTGLGLSVFGDTLRRFLVRKQALTKQRLWPLTRQSQRFSGMRINVIAIAIVILLCSLLVVPLYSLLHKSQISPGILTNNISDEMKLESQYFKEEGIGLSDGEVVFDTYSGRVDVSLKEQAAACLQHGDTSCAINFMTQAISTDVSDGEIQIYNEDLHVLQSGAPYVTIVLGLAIASAPTYLLRARAIMQAAFLAQREINTGGLLPHHLRLRILIDNSGADTSHVATAAQFVANRVRSGNADHIIAVVGWPFSSQTLDALDIITGVQIPMISQAASSTLLSGSSPYFFRVNPTDSEQGDVLGAVAVNQFHAKTILLMEDPTDPYSVSLANAFSNSTSVLKVNVIHNSTSQFTIGNTSVSEYQQGVVKEITQRNVDLVFLAGFDVDAIRLAHAIGNASRADPKNTSLIRVKVMSGDAVATGLVLGYGGGDDAAIAAQFPQDMQRLIFSSFAHPDEWTFNKIPKYQQPQFFSDWLNTYRNISIDTTSISQPGSHAILTFDAIQVIVHAITLVKTSLDGEAIRIALLSLGKGRIPAFQGVGGPLTFDDQGDPIDKAFVILDIENVNGKNNIMLKQVVGNFFI